MSQEALCPTVTPVEMPREAAVARQTGRIREFIGAYRLHLCVALVLLIFGIALRLTPMPGPELMSVDEALYIANTDMVKKGGLADYPNIVQHYVDVQSRMKEVILPPTRCLYVICAYLWSCAFGTDLQDSLHGVAATFSVLTLLLAGIAAARMGGSRYGLAVFALMAVTPIEIGLAHRELVDGFFAFWALLSFWLLWENLQRPGRAGWLAAYACAIAAMVLTKENAFFAFVGLCGAMALTPWLRLGKLKFDVIAATVAGGLLGVAILVLVSGGLPTLIETYRLLVTKAEQMEFAYNTGGGPWYRYIVDLLLVSPAVLLAAVGGVFTLRRENKPAIYLLLLIVFSYALMTNVRNGMNLRYATMWDMPLRFLAASALFHVAAHVRRCPQFTLAGLVSIVGLVDLRSYYVIFWQHHMVEPVTIYLMRALEIIRLGRQ